MNTKRNCFYSFHYMPDNWRVATVRSIGVIDGNRPATDNNWETVKGGGDAAIKRWITGQMKGRSCTVVLVGSNTAGRKWITHEISESWNAGMGVVAIHVNGLKDGLGSTSSKGGNPLDSVTFNSSGKKLSTIAKCYTPSGTNSREKYAWISKHLANVVEESIRIRKAN